MELVKITVTKEDINSGSKKSCFDCPIAYSIMRDMQLSYRNVSVAKTIQINHQFNHIELPKWLKRWIIAYDKGEYVQPIEFYIIKKKFPNAWVIEIE